jgi:hypothetical protein
MLTQSTLKSRSLPSRRWLLAVLATAGLALTGSAPAGAAKYTQQKSHASSSGNITGQWDTAVSKRP